MRGSSQIWVGMSMSALHGPQILKGWCTAALVEGSGEGGTLWRDPWPALEGCHAVASD